VSKRSASSFPKICHGVWFYTPPTVLAPRACSLLPQRQRCLFFALVAENMSQPAQVLFMLWGQQ
jgi:hypothetical protein